MKTYEDKCDELAALFLSDHPHLDTDDRLFKLSGYIQLQIKMWFACEEDNYDGPNDGPQDDPDFAGFAENH